MDENQKIEAWKQYLWIQKNKIHATNKYQKIYFEALEYKLKKIINKH